MSATKSRGLDDGIAALRRSLAAPRNLQVWIDFDGTITRKDVLDELILAFAKDESWRTVETRWQAGEIGSYICLREEFDVLRVDASSLARFLQSIPIDPGAAALFQLLCDNRVKTAILSDGVESFIHAILQRAGIELVPIRANRIEHVNDQLTLLCPHRAESCQTDAAHCKCASIAALGSAGHTSIYIGDGRSDLCPARKVDVVFAKNALARILLSEGRPFIPFDTLNDVRRILADAWAGVAVSS